MSSDVGEPDAKRAREACLNCRRKKTRCPGERPVCGFCVRLGQTCHYASAVAVTTSTTSATDRTLSLAPKTGAVTTADALPLSPPPSTASVEQAGRPHDQSTGDLVNRVTQLEAQLRAQLGYAASNGGPALQTPMLLAQDVRAPTSPLKRKFSATSESPFRKQQSSGFDQLDADSGHDDYSHQFTAPPPATVLKHLIDVYFANCQNQPYCFFHESNMRRRILADEVPHYLILAMAASAVRYSMHDFYKNNQMAAVESYARASWVILLERFFADDQCPDVAMAQATALLAAINFTGESRTLCASVPHSFYAVHATANTVQPRAAGHHRLGWVKVGLAIRLVQDLRLSVEPEATLPVWQKEETRRVFWSLYLLDKFFACSRTRPVSILDIDCTLELPCNEEAFREETALASMPTLAVLNDSFDFTSRARLDNFAVLTLMCSLLSRSVKNVIHDGKITVPCWDCRSEFAQTSSILMSFESIHSAGDLDMKAHLADRFGTYEGFDRQRVGHFVWARGIYHLCGSMLYHPLALYRHRQACGQAFPATFAREVLSRCQHHLAQLGQLLGTVQTTGCCARGSILGYLAACTASIHKIFLHSTDQQVAAQALAGLQTCIQFLQQPPVCWPNYITMAAAVSNFEVDPDLARRLNDPLIPPTLQIEPSQMDHLRRAIDYAWLSDAGRTKPPEDLSVSSFDASGDGWTPFGGFDDGTSTYTLHGNDIDFDFPHGFNKEPFLEVYPGI